MWCGMPSSALGSRGIEGLAEAPGPLGCDTAGLALFPFLPQPEMAGVDDIHDL